MSTKPTEILPIIGYLEVFGEHSLERAMLSLIHHGEVLGSVEEYMLVVAELFESGVPTMFEKLSTAMKCQSESPATFTASKPNPEFKTWQLKEPTVPKGCNRLSELDIAFLNGSPEMLVAESEGGTLPLATAKHYFKAFQKWIDIRPNALVKVELDIKSPEYTIRLIDHYEKVMIHSITLPSNVGGTKLELDTLSEEHGILNVKEALVGIDKMLLQYLKTTVAAMRQMLGSFGPNLPLLCSIDVDSENAIEMEKCVWLPWRARLIKS